ncbi:MAG TPA: hypothetical protein VKY85_26280 [Candidatus Angelobacter sp.]|nr:hypothetical protein [Candidatus Angelobacter sp.]
MSKWEKFYSIEPSCWQQITPSGASNPIWLLDKSYTSQYYPGVYHSILRDGDPFQRTWNVCRFNKVAPIGMIELTIRSSRTNFRDYYEITLNPLHMGIVGFPPREIPRFDASNSNKTGAATLHSGGRSIRIVSPDIDEDMSIDLETLQVTLAESRQEQQDRLLPWTRMLWWYGHLQEVDIQAFQRLRPPVQNYLRGPKYAEAASRLSEMQLKAWQQEKLMPFELAWLWKNEMPEEVTKLETVLDMVKDPLRQANPIYMPVIPNLLRFITPSKLELLDMKVLMTIGAVRERWRFKAREWQKLLQRKPAFKALAESPNGQQLAAQDPDWIAVTNHPLAREEEEEDMEAYQHSKGDFGPSYQEQMRQSDVMFNTMMAGMMQQDRQMTMMLGGMGLPVGPPLQIPTLSNPLLQKVPALAWKVYRPYMM